MSLETIIFSVGYPIVAAVIGGLLYYFARRSGWVKSSRSRFSKGNSPS